VSVALYGGALLAAAPRVLGLLDRQPESPTAGCGDRSYWAWKFVDAPAPRLQESVAVLAFLYATPLAGSPYHRQPRLLGWIESALAFWSRLQHRDGSFDEAYPFERSLAATAFTTYYVGEALERLGGELSAEAGRAATATMARAAAWLARNDEGHGFLSNHLAAAAGALLHAARRTGERRFAARAGELVDRVLARQSAEGWYEEYGGADPGYQTHGSYYLARCWQLGGDERLLPSLARAARFLAHFVHPDGSLGGVYASRDTQTCYPAAYEMLAARDPASAWLAETLRSSLANGSAVGLDGVDRFNYLPFLNNFVAAHDACAGREPLPPAADPTPPAGLAWFPEAGLARWRTARCEVFVGAAKGGVVQLFDRRRRRLVYSDCGYVGRLRSGRTVASQYLDRARAVRIEGEAVVVEGALAELTRPRMTPALFLAFRLFTLTLGRLPTVARWLKRRLAQALIHRRRPLAVRFERRIELGERSLRVRDRLTGPDGRRLRELRWEPFAATVHMGSARYFVAHELHRFPAGETVDARAVAAGLALERTAAIED
jgi:hypothetical protein